MVHQSGLVTIMRIIILHRGTISITVIVLLMIASNHYAFESIAASSSSQRI